MKTIEVANRLVQLCKEGKNLQAIESLYSKDIKSIEGHAPAGQSRESDGIEAILAKTKWWNENHTVHSAAVDGPFPFDDKFAVVFKYDITQKSSGKRFPMEEIAIYYVQNAKITREEFWYKGM